MATILVVDDELGIRALLSEILSDEGHTIELAENAAQARAARERSRPDLVLLDIWMPDVDGVTLLKEWGGAGLLTMPVIMMSGHGTIDTAVEATKFGAIAFLEKPITLQKLLRAVEQALVKTAPPRAAPASVGLPTTYAARPEATGLGLGLNMGHMPVVPALGVNLSSSHLPSGIGNIGNALASEQSFELDRPLREARDAFEKR